LADHLEGPLLLDPPSLTPILRTPFRYPTWRKPLGQPRCRNSKGGNTIWEARWWIPFRGTLLSPHLRTPWGTTIAGMYLGDHLLGTPWGLLLRGTPSEPYLRNTLSGTQRRQLPGPHWGNLLAEPPAGPPFGTPLTDHILGDSPRWTKIVERKRGHSIGDPRWTLLWKISRNASADTGGPPGRTHGRPHMGNSSCRTTTLRPPWGLPLSDRMWKTIL
jgi:hypothetical protein